MPFYVRRGELPRVKHTAFRKGDGPALYREELFSSRGFAGPYSTRYHLGSPSALLRSREIALAKAEPWAEAPLSYLHCFTDRLEAGGDFLSARRTLLANAQVGLATAQPTANADFFFRNAWASEYLFVHRGDGVLRSEFGDLRFGPGDQLVVPRGTTYRLDLDRPEGNKLLVVECDQAFEIPAHYRNGVGQLEEHAPYCERDLRVPELAEPRDAKGEFRLILKAGERAFEQVLANHPFDVVGWDGYLFPFALNLRDFHPKVGRIHLPPPAHLFLRNDRLALCNFVPRPFDFHPDAIPVPYFHSNVDCDEVLYYAGGEFMSRKGIVEGSLTLHPAGMPHGPQPGKIEASLGKTSTDEWAVMVDTFAPLRPTANARRTLDEGYAQSWLEPPHQGTAEGAAFGRSIGLVRGEP